MANEGYLGKVHLSGERAATDDHPVILHALTLDSTVVAALPVGTLLKRIAEVGSGNGATYAPCTIEADTPCAVVDKPCDPTGDHGETSAICIVHGTVKAHILKMNNTAASRNMMDKLMQCGIYSI